MRDEAYRSVIVALLLSHNEEKEKQRCAQLLDHLREIFNVSYPKHERLVEECLKYKTYILEVTALHLHTNEKVLLTIESPKCSKSVQYTLNGGEQYHLDIGPFKSTTIRCSVVKMNGQKGKASIRSQSFLRRVISEKKHDDGISTDTLPLDIQAKRTFTLKGKNYHLEMKLTHRTSDLPPPQIEFEDLLDFVRAIHEHDACGQEDSYSGELCESSFSLLHLTFLFHSIPSIVLKTICLSIFLVWDKSISDLDDYAIPNLTAFIQSHSEAPEVSYRYTKSMEHLFECLITNVDEISEDLQSTSLFPPTNQGTLTSIHNTLKPVVQICALPIWDYIDSLDPAHYLANRLAQLIDQSTQNWAQQYLFSPELSSHCLCTLLQETSQAIHSFHPAYCIYFRQFSIDYIERIFSGLDEELERSVRKIVEVETARLDSRDADALDEFTRATMKMYVALGNLRMFTTEKRVCPSALSDFESWFTPCLVFWTFCWREISQRMVGRTACLEEDGESRQAERRPLPAGLYSFLCIQKGISDDVCVLALKDQQNVVMITLKIVNIFCENLLAYARKLYVESKAEMEDKMLPESTSYGRCVRAVNGIDQAVGYIEENWKRFVDWKRVELILPHEESDAVYSSIKGMIKAARQHCDLLAEKVVERVCGGRKDETVKQAKQLCVDGNEYMKTLAAYVRDRSHVLHNIENVVHSVEKMVDQLERELMPRRFKHARRRLYGLFEREVSTNLKDHQSPEYYRNIYVAMKVIREIFGAPKTPSDLQKSLHLKSLSTEELILSHYADMTDMSDRVVGGANICLQTAYIRSNDEQIILLLNVRDARLPSVSASPCVSDCVCRMELLPKCLFSDENFPPATTPPVLVGPNPKWKQAYQVVIPQTSFFTNGATLCLNVIDHDRLGCDRLLGRAFVALNKVKPYEMVQERHPLRRKFAPQIAHPLLSPSAGNKLPFFQILRDRSVSDPVARQFWQKERTARELQIGIRHLKQVPSRINSLRRIGSERTFSLISRTAKTAKTI